jgi:hypothetical protein
VDLLPDDLQDAGCRSRPPIGKNTSRACANADRGRPLRCHSRGADRPSSSRCSRPALHDQPHKTDSPSPMLRQLNRSGFRGGCSCWPQPLAVAGFERSSWLRARPHSLVRTSGTRSCWPTASSARCYALSAARSTSTAPHWPLSQFRARSVPDRGVLSGQPRAFTSYLTYAERRHMRPGTILGDGTR